MWSLLLLCAWLATAALGSAGDCKRDCKAALMWRLLISAGLMLCACRAAPDIQDWAGPALEAVGTDARLQQTLLSNLRSGFLLCSDYSGYGCAEFAANVLCAKVVERGDPANVCVWRSSDISPVKRKMLCRGPHAALHVFGSLISRVPTQVRASIGDLSAEFKDEFSQISRRNAGAFRQLGEAFTTRLRTLLAAVRFRRNARLWCYKCRSRCRLYGPRLRTPEDTLHVVVAGTTCTPWSAMGRRGHWAADETVAFLVWLYEIRALQPDVVIHECTQFFDWTIFTTILAGLYVVRSLVWSPVDVGFPANRPRRWTQLCHLRNVVEIIPCTLGTFSSLFFRETVFKALDLFRAPQAVLEEMTRRWAVSKHLPPTQYDGAPWPHEVLLAAGDLGRLLGYERLMRKARLRFDKVLNIMQTAKYFGIPRRHVVPTLLTRTSVLWSQTLRRIMIPEERLETMGIPFFDDRAFSDRHGIEQMWMSGELTEADLLHACGNGMVQCAIGNMLLFALSTTARSSPDRM